jgi:hypothetical protein
MTRRVGIDRMTSFRRTQESIFLVMPAKAGIRFARRPGEGRDPAFHPVIPRKREPSDSDLQGCRQDRLTSLCFSSGILPAGYFLLLVQKKVTKEKDTLGDCTGRRAAGSRRSSGFD